MAGPEGERTAQQSKPTEQLKPQLEGGNGSPGFPPNLQERAKPPPESQALPTLPPADGGRKITSVQIPLFENCIVRDLMSSSDRVDEIFAQGLITEEQAAQQKKEALAIERAIWIADRIQGIRRSVRDHEVSATEKRHLRAEYKGLRKESRLLKKQLWES
jgi:hypothetical protein